MLSFTAGTATKNSFAVHRLGDIYGEHTLKILIVVLPCVLISSRLFFCQQMRSLLKHKMLQLTLKISLYIAPTCFGPLGPSSGSIRRHRAKVTVTLARFRHMLPDDGPSGPKHAGAT
jgi:hypothetical protein